MPVYPCRWPTCRSYVPRRGAYCKVHEQHGRQDRRDRDRLYDRYARDPEARAFYGSAAWQRARATKLARCVTCERCKVVFARHVHHRKPLKDYPELALAQDNLEALCIPCHNQAEAETGGN